DDGRGPPGRHAAADGLGSAAHPAHAFLALIGRAMRRGDRPSASNGPAPPLSPDLPTPAAGSGLSRDDIEDILGVARALATPVDLLTMLDAVSATARRVLRSERSSVWLLDAAADELVLETGSGLASLRVPAHAGLLGACVRGRATVNVPDCYADPRFDPSMDA